MVIVGAGAIGMEFAYVLANYGVDVTIVEFMDRVLPNEDEDVSKVIAKEYKKLGVKLLTGHKTTAIEDKGDSVEVKVESKDGKKSETLTVDRVMVSIGFAPRTEGIGLDKAGVEVGERGEIPIDDYMRTNVDHIYSIGDVTMKLQLAHVAETMGVIAAEHMAGHETDVIEDYLNMPRATFCNPQVASFGKTEAQAKKWAEENDRRSRSPPSRSPPTARRRSGGGHRLRQAHRRRRAWRAGRRPMVGANVSELMPSWCWRRSTSWPPRRSAAPPHHPTMSEAMKIEAAEGLMGER